jgi:hypothetical protein
MTPFRTLNSLEALELALAQAIKHAETCARSLDAARARIGLPPLPYRRDAEVSASWEGMNATAQLIVDSGAVRRGEAASLADAAAQRLRVVPKPADRPPGSAVLDAIAAVAKQRGET